MLAAVPRRVDRSCSVSSLGSALSAIDNFFRERCSLHPRPNLSERLFSRSRSVVAEGRETAVIRGSKLFYWNISRCLENSVANFFGILDPRIDRGDNSNEYPLLRFEVFSDHLQHSGAIRFAG